MCVFIETVPVCVFIEMVPVCVHIETVPVCVLIETVPGCVLIETVPVCVLIETVPAGDVPGRDGGDSGCDRAASVPEDHGASLQADIYVCVKSSLPGE